MKNRVFAIIVLLITMSVVAPGICAEPYVDSGFTLQSPNNDIDLIVVRENYDPNQYTQAIYFRAYDNTSDFDAIAGTISFPPEITIVKVYDDPVNSDATWAINGIDYSGLGRGLDADDRFSSDAHTVTFDCGFDRGMDDFRIIVAYDGAFTDGATFSIQLNNGPRPPGGFPYSTGIQVGNTDGVVQGSGDYGEITELTVPLTPGTPPPTLEGRVEDLEAQVDILFDQCQSLTERAAELEERAAELEEAQEALRNHTHPYLTGKGKGHNNRKAETGPAEFSTSP
jgi:hypothetical protein